MDRRLPAGAGDHGPARTQAARAAGGRQGLREQAVRHGRGEDAHPQPARGAPAVPAARAAQRGARAGARAHRRAARERGALPRLTELATDWYWEQDEDGHFTKVSGPVLEMLGMRVDGLVDGRPRTRRRLEPGRARALQAQSRSRQPVPGLRVRPASPDGLSQTFRVSGTPMLDRPANSLAIAGLAWRSPGRDRAPAATPRHAAARRPEPEPASGRAARGGIRAPRAPPGSWSR